MRPQTSLTPLQAELDMLTHWHFAFKTNLTTGLTMRHVADLHDIAIHKYIQNAFYMCT